jgi:hypothetical protein
MRLVLSFYLFHRCSFSGKLNQHYFFLAEAYWFGDAAMLSVLMYHFPGCLCSVLFLCLFMSCFHLVGNLGL